MTAKQQQLTASQFGKYSVILDKKGDGAGITCYNIAEGCNSIIKYGGSE